ncbi:aspartate--tRNA ligase [Buchnera aphidicola (Ceratoglyphina bambusae)]|uniref:aspartate--tRNA ligase n=1 Tax=Buchnera aphidicola TaxID=9 RepID=UPI0031B887AB
MKRKYCGDITEKLIGKKVYLYGWIKEIKNFGHFIFMNIEDIRGNVQIIIKKKSKVEFSKINKIKNGFCVKVLGIVKKRNKKNINSKIKNGNIEIYVNKIKIFSKSKNIPIDLLKKNSEKNRLKYRYLDLRTKEMHNNLILRSKVIFFIHKFMQKKKFVYVETPILTKSTPEGARDYVVPSRKHHGEFYALPQSPQLFKQLLMISKLDKYYQIAKCFRDEDSRSNRQPEFTQIDIEASFINENEIMYIIEKLIYKIWKKFRKIELKKFPTITYKKSIKKYGTETPDIRNPLKIINFSDFFKKNNIIHNNEKILGIHISSKNRPILNNIKCYKKIATRNGIKKIYFIKLSKKNINNCEFNKINIFSKKIFKKIIKKFNFSKNDTLIISNSNNKNIYKTLGIILKKIAIDLNLINKNSYSPIWITDFPTFKKDKNGNISSTHHPFTSPKNINKKNMKKSTIKSSKSKSYDLVINGKEIGGGSIRIHNIKLQKLIFKILNLSKKTQKEKFGFFINALKYGPPPHAGIALGLDRIIMLLINDTNIKNVIAFPKTTNATCLMTNSPSKLENYILKNLNIKIKNI